MHMKYLKNSSLGISPSDDDHDTQMQNLADLMGV